MNNIKKLKMKETELLHTLDLHSLGVVISFFDQRHGPIPVKHEPQILSEEYSKIMQPSDVAFSTGRFVKNFTDEEKYRFTFNLDDFIWVY